MNTASATAVPVTLGKALAHTVTLAWSSAPLSLIVIPALVAAALVKRDRVAAWMAAFSLLALLIPATEALIYHDLTQMQLDKGLPLMLISVFGAAVIFRSATTLRPLVAAVLILAMVGSVVQVWRGMDDYPYQTLEQAFHRAIATGHSQEGTVSRGGIRVGIDPELAMAQYLDAHVRAPKSVITDNAQTYGVILLTGQARLFQTRIDHGDTDWLRAVRHPPRSVHYMLVARNASGDLIRQIYPEISTGESLGLTPVYTDSRYVLLRVAPGVNAQTQSTLSSGATIAPAQSPGTIPSLRSSP